MRTNIADARQKIELSRAARLVAANVVGSGNNGRGRGRRRPFVRSRPAPAANRNGRFLSSPMRQRIGFQRSRGGGRIERGRISRKATFSNSGMYSDRQQTRKTLENFRVVAQNRFRRRSTSQNFTTNDDDDETLTRTIRNDRINRGRARINRSERTNFISNNNNRGTFRAALQEIEKSRNDMNEVVIQSYNSSVFDRLAPAQSKSADISANKRGQSTGYRVYITNLNPSVTEDDVEELFGSIGVLTSSGLKRPGIAYANFSRLQDARRAITEFNNRELDGIPMKCVLENDSTSKQTPTVTKPALKRVEIIQRENSTSEESMEVDKDFINQVLFSNDDATSSKQAVQFTVKI